MNWLITINRKKNEQKNIIVIEDNKTFIKSLTDFLNTDVISITVCADCTEALQSIIARKPEFIICNYKISPFTGTGFAAFLKLSELYDDIKFILFTSENINTLPGREFCDYIYSRELNNLKKISTIILPSG